MSFFPTVNRWLIPGTLLALSARELAIDGRNGNEGTCFWLGHRANSEATVSHLAILRGPGVEKSPFNVRVSAELMRQLHDEAMSRDLILVAQVHSHSGDCGVDMSPTDHAYGISVPFFLSVICPDYALTDAITITECGVHVCLPRSGYVRLSRGDTIKKIVQLSNSPASTIVVGNQYETKFHKR